MSIDERIRALADPTRRGILRALRRSNLTAGAIASRFPITAASISHHLGVLREVGLVQSERAGRTIVYSLDTTMFQEFADQMMTLLDAGGESAREDGDRE